MAIMFVNVAQTSVTPCQAQLKFSSGKRFSNFLMTETVFGNEEGSQTLYVNSIYGGFLFNCCSSSMSHQAWTIADLPHRHWKLKYLPDEFRACDIKDENHPYYSLLQTFDQLRDLRFYTDDIPMLVSLEPKLKQIGKIIDKLIDLPGPHAKGIFDFTALSAYVHTINDLWSKRNQMFMTPIWRQPLGYEMRHYKESLVYDPELFTQLNNISLIFDWWLGKPQFDFWIGIIDLNFDIYPTQLEAYVHWYNAVFFPRMIDDESSDYEWSSSSDC
ncbi:9548_t:CDS:2 [Gigaspora margarita]|uniref:9548_t:CDS:1 n=1 Tax=Gigaspora margarita TaxID=4874 RepID=A0ABN7UDW9_GIGMA|nr:9548_t:CDS:2 [Gigaspora margarita]